MMDEPVASDCTRTHTVEGAWIGYVQSPWCGGVRGVAFNLRRGGGVSWTLANALADMYLRGGMGGEDSSKFTNHFGAS